MSDFAKAQLLKYGWTEGKGLGKNENGIAEAIKPKLKFDTSGIGHKESDFEWWDSVYDKALKNIVLNKKSDKVSITVSKKNAFNIASTKSGLDITKKKCSHHYGKFLKTSTLQNGNLIRDSTYEEDVEDNVQDNPTIIKMSDEELFKACGGRTAHKGARHGLKLSGKLARIAEQERQLLASSFLKSNGESSHSSKCKGKERKKKKSKKSMEIEENALAIIDEQFTEECDILPLPTQKDKDYKASKKTCRKVHRKIHNLTHQLVKSCMIQDDASKDDHEKDKMKKKIEKKKSKRKRHEDADDCAINNFLDDDVLMEPNNKKSRKSTSDERHNFLNTDKQSDKSLNYDQDCLLEVRSTTKCRKETHHTLTEADRLNAKIKHKKCRKFERKQKKKLEELSKSLLAVSLDKKKNKRSKHAKKIKM